MTFKEVIVIFFLFALTLLTDTAKIGNFGYIN
jgi:hypothetical protein